MQIVPLGSTSSPPSGPYSKDSSGKGLGYGGNECDSLYVVGFPRSWDKNHLYQFFSSYGIVRTTHIIPPSSNDQVKSAGSVSLMTKAMAREALAKTNGMLLPDGIHLLEVKYKLPTRRPKGDPSSMVKGGPGGEPSTGGGYGPPQGATYGGAGAPLGGESY